MAIADRIYDIAEPLAESLGLDLVDVEYNGGLLRITVDQEGGLLLDTVAELSRSVSRELDAQDPINGSYTLEVSSPGLERRLRKPHHFARSVGEDVTLKLGPHVEGERRLAGKITAADDDSVTIVDDDGEVIAVPFADITKARTVFEWGPTPKPGGPKKGKKGTKGTKSNKAQKKPQGAAGKGANPPVADAPEGNPPQNRKAAAT